jgi:methionine-S-sulfoxide reductase
MKTLKSIPEPVVKSSILASQGKQVAVFAGGCFWGVESVFEHVKGVTNVVSGFSGGSSATASYDKVSGGDTGHAEAVEVTYDPKQVRYGQLLKIFFAVAHDPTQRDRQGPDWGSQYRSAIFFANSDQKKMAYVRLKRINNTIEELKKKILEVSIKTVEFISIIHTTKHKIPVIEVEIEETFKNREKCDQQKNELEDEKNRINPYYNKLYPQIQWPFRVRR